MSGQKLVTPLEPCTLSALASTADLFSPLALRSVTLPNRVGMSPMCMYAAVDGHPNDWHLAHLGMRAAGGVGLVIAEATAVEAIGRISAEDTGIWDDAHVAPWARVATFIRQQGAVAGIQLAHAGRKAGTRSPWRRSPGLPLHYRADEGGWTPVGPSPTAFDTAWPVPHALTPVEVERVVMAFRRAAQRALDAGFQLVEIHAAHGYLLHQFHSPLSNLRDDAYGGDFAQRTRLTREVVAAIRSVWPAELPLAIRLSCTDWAPGGWTLDDAVALSAQLRPMGVDLVDCSSGGAVPGIAYAVAPLWQAPLAQRIRAEAGVMTAAVGEITTPAEAQHLVHDGHADVVLLGKQLLREPMWALRAAKELGQLEQLRLAGPYDYVIRK